MRPRLLLYVIALVVLPTAVLSMLAAMAVRDREQNMQRRLETAAERTVRGVSQTLMARLVAAHSEVLQAGAEAQSLQDLLSHLATAGAARAAFQPVGQPYIIRLPNAFLYPQGISAGSRPTAAEDESLMAAIRAIRDDSGGAEKAVREYEKILAVRGITFPALAEATLGAGRCYRDLGEFKLAAGAFRQVAGYPGGQDDVVQRARDADGNVYSMMAMKELTGTYRLAAERDLPETRGRWRRLAVESEVELLERLVLLYCDISAGQREATRSALQGILNAEPPATATGQAAAGAGRQKATDAVPSYEHKARARTGELQSLLREQERNLEFLAADGGAVMDAVTGEIGNNGIPARMTWLVIRGTPFTFGARDGIAGSMVGGFKVDMAGLEAFLRNLSERIASEHGVVVRIERAGPAGGGPARMDGFLTAVTLEWPFNGMTLSAYAADPGVLKRNTALWLMLQEWGIAMLALGVLAGAWVVFRHAAAETRRLKERGDYIAGVSHDLRTPLASMRMLAESLYLGRVEDPARQKQFLETIIGESRRLGHLVERVLFFVRFGENALAYQLRKTDIGEVVRQAVDAFTGSLALETDKPQDMIRLDIEPDLPPVMADPVAVSQVVLNLLDNAVKYSRKAGPPVAVGAGGERSAHGEAGGALEPGCPHPGRPVAAGGVSPRIDVRLAREGDGGIQLSVQDDGPGMDKRELRKIFRKFYRVPGGGKDAAPGTGLGLALCRHIVLGHGGRIVAESEPGKGSVFRVYLPRL